MARRKRKSLVQDEDEEVHFSSPSVTTTRQTKTSGRQPVTTSSRRYKNNTGSASEVLFTPPTRRSNRQRARILASSSSDGSNQQNGNTSSSGPSSIRQNARIATISGSTGTRQSGSTYRYRRMKLNHDFNLEDELVRNAPPSPTAASTSDDAPPLERHCYCDVACSNCTSAVPCEIHNGVYCSGCSEWFHLTCIGWKMKTIDGFKHIQAPWDESVCIPLESPSQDVEDELSSPWYCIRCWERTKDKDKNSVPKWADCNLEEQALRIGVELDPDVFRQTNSRRILKYTKELREIIGDDDVYNGIIHSKPRSFPSPKPMDTHSKLLHARQGRRFDIDLLTLVVESCDCCGRTQPYAVDPWQGKKAKASTFHRQSLNRMYHDAIFCNCKTVCKTSQFYSLSRKKQMDFYKTRHDHEPPYDSNARLCEVCHSELTRGNGK